MTDEDQPQNTDEPKVSESTSAAPDTTEQSAEPTYTGLSRADAEALAESVGASYRVSRIDGVSYMFPASDIQFERLNFVLEKGIVTEVYKG